LKLKESIGLRDSDLDIIRRLIKGEKLDDSEVRRLSDLYIKLQTNPFLNRDNPIGQLIESEIKRIRTEYAGAEPYSYYTLEDLEKSLKEKILRGEVPEVSPGRRVIWGLQDILKSIDVVNQGYNAFYNFLRERGLDPGIASAIASAVVTGGIVVLGGIAPPIAAGLVGVSLANTVSQISEYLDEYERKLFADEFSKILDPSKAPPDQRQFYEDARKELIGSLVGAVVGGLGIGKAASPLVKTLKDVIASKNPKLAQKLGIMEKYLGYGELQAKTQDYMIYYDKDLGVLTIQVIEKGDITKPQAVVKLPQEYITIVKGKSKDELVGLVKTLRNIYGKEDVSDEIKAVLDRVKSDVEKLGLQLNDENVAKFLNNYRNFLSKMLETAPDTLKGRSATELAERLIYVRYGGKEIPGLDLGDRVTFLVGNTQVNASKGALASLEVTDRLKSLGVFDDVVSLLRQGLRGEKGVIVKGDRVVEVYPDGRLVITRGLQKETYSIFDPRYLEEARRLLENYDNELLKSLGKVVTAGYTTQPQLTPTTQPADVVPDLLKNSFKVAGDYTDISLASEGKTLRLMVNKELRGIDENILLRYSWDVVYAKDKSLLDKLLKNTPGYERFRGEVIVVNEKARGYLNKYLSSKTPTKEELRNAVENALKEAAGKDPEAAASLKQLQVLLTSMEKSPGSVVPVVVSDTGKELVIGVATTTASLSKLSSEDIQKLGLKEEEVTVGLKPVYIEEKYPVPIIQPYEVTQPIYIPGGVEEIPLETEESIKLKPIYVETPYPVPVVKEVEETKAVFIPETVEIPYEVSETIRLKPVYIEVPYQVPITQSVEITKPVYISETIEVPLETSETVALKPVYIEEVYTIPILKEIQKTEVITQPEEVIIPLTARQLADVVVIPIEIPSFITIYYPYSEPLPIPPEIPHAVGVVPTPPLLPKPKEELRKGEVRKAREVEKVVL
jgi:hypothetical protein